MRRLVFKLCVLAAIAALFLSILVWRFETGAADFFYTNFTKPKAASLIVGTSRTAQGLKPQVLQEVLHRKGISVAPIHNFAFTALHSSFGPAYLDLIQRKVDTTATTDAIFIVAVDPWAISALSEEETTPDTFRERGSFVSKLRTIDARPNLEYIFRHYNQPYYWALYDSFKKKFHLHPDGWLEVNVMSNAATVEAKTKVKVQEYAALEKHSSLSPIRLKSLKATLGFLRRHGRVYLVRIPTSAPMAALEQQYQPGFDMLMQQLSRTCQVPYFNYIHQAGQYRTTDGNHLHKSASQQLSEILAADIAALEQQRKPATF